MKKVFVFLICNLLVLACVEDVNVELDHNQLQTRFSQDFESFMDEIWDYHNNVVLELISTLENPTNSEIIDGFDVYNQEHGNYLYDKLFALTILNKMLEDDNYLQFLRTQGIIANLPSPLKNEVTAVMNIYENSYTSREDLYTAIINVKGNTSNLEVYASVQIAEASYNLWDEYFSDDNTAAIGPLVQADCIGYLWGWAGAWWTEQGPNYSNSWSAQKRRIGVGVATAGAASTLGKIKYH